MISYERIDKSEKINLKKKKIRMYDLSLLVF